MIITVYLGRVFILQIMYIHQILCKFKWKI